MDEAERREKARRGRAESGARGLLLGLALGDTWGAARGAPPSTGVLRAAVATQLACFTAEGLIRASVRGSHKGICHPPSVVWHAYCRWAAVQGVEPEAMRRRWGSGTGEGRWPDGWLARVPALAERRGSAPATVAALAGGRQGTADRPATGSRGWHALARTLPVAAFRPAADGRTGARLSCELAALTHGDPAAQAAAAHGTRLLRHCLDADSAADALHAGAAPPPTEESPARESAAAPGERGCAGERRCHSRAARRRPRAGRPPARRPRAARAPRPGPDRRRGPGRRRLRGRVLPRPRRPARRAAVRGRRAGRGGRRVRGRRAAGRGARRRGAPHRSGEPARTRLGTGHLGPRPRGRGGRLRRRAASYVPAWDRTWATRYPGW